MFQQLYVNRWKKLRNQRNLTPKLLLKRLFIDFNTSAGVTGRSRSCFGDLYNGARAVVGQNKREYSRLIAAAKLMNSVFGGLQLRRAVGTLHWQK